MCGVVHTGSPQGQEPGHVRPLTGCVMDSGALAAFPTDDQNVRENLGLAFRQADRPLALAFSCGQLRPLP